MEDNEIKIKLSYNDQEKIIDKELNSYNDLQEIFLQLFNPKDQSLNKYQFYYKYRNFDVNIYKETDLQLIITEIKKHEDHTIYVKYIYNEDNKNIIINQSVENFGSSAISIDNEINISTNNNNISSLYFEPSQTYKRLIRKINEIKSKLEAIKNKKEENINYKELIQILSINLSLIENDFNEANDKEKIEVIEYNEIKDSIFKLKNDINEYKQKNMDLIIRLFTKELKKVTDDSESFKKSFLEKIDKLNIM